MSLPIQIISTDFDGTIFAEFENPPVAAKFVALIGELQAQGVKWVINTGRDMSGLMEALGRAQLPVRPDALVLVEREIYFHQHARYVGHEEWNQRCTADHAALFARIRPDLERLTDWIEQRYEATVYEDPYSPLCLIARHLADAEAIHDHLDEYCRTVPNLQVVRNDVYARLAHTGYDKGKALAEIARHWQVGRDHILAAGDHLNDLPMLSRDYARWLVTNANAITRVQALVRQQDGFVSRLTAGAGVAEGIAHCLAAARAAGS